MYDVPAKQETTRDLYAMSELTKLVVVRLEGQRYALRLDAVQRIVRAVEVTPMPKAPAAVAGAINVGGNVLPVFNIRRRLKLPEREINPSDQFVIAQAGQRAVVVIVDAAEGVIECPPNDFVASADIVPGLDQIQGMVKLKDGLALIHDLETFLSLDEARILDEAMSQEVISGN
jgi:purine-binding chemotaxis protein CheW